MKLQNTTSINMWYTETLLHGGFKNKKVIKFTTTNYCSAQGLEKGETRDGKRELFTSTRAGILTCWLLVNSVKAYIVAGTYSTNSQYMFTEVNSRGSKC